MVQSSNDRRGFVRVPFNTQALVVAGDKTVQSRDGIDISMSGIRIQCEGQADFRLGAPCEVKVMLVAAEQAVTIEAKGTIVRSDTTCLGIRFDEIDLDSYHHLKQLILHNTTEPERAEQEFNAHWGIRPAHRRETD